ncbi:MAG: hypothetical protein M1826_006609 [Phylliscum demangeonii]|nr:MAG: hypothetical protein M1826_006609 [Phylliscum demangeonii]
MRAHSLLVLCTIASAVGAASIQSLVARDISAVPVFDNTSPLGKAQTALAQATSDEKALCSSIVAEQTADGIQPARQQALQDAIARSKAAAVTFHTLLKSSTDNGSQQTKYLVQKEHLNDATRNHDEAVRLLAAYKAANVGLTKQPVSDPALSLAIMYTYKLGVDRLQTHIDKYNRQIQALTTAVQSANSDLVAFNNAHLAVAAPSPSPTPSPVPAPSHLPAPLPLPVYHY